MRQEEGLGGVEWLDGGLDMISDEIRAGVTITRWSGVQSAGGERNRDPRKLRAVLMQAIERVLGISSDGQA